MGEARQGGVDGTDREQCGSRPQAPRADLNLFCLECGYNLRGLTGDPLRCPECGTQNRLSDLVVSLRAVAKQLERMETLPTICIAATWAMALGICVVWLTGVAWVLVLVALAAIVCGLAAAWFAKSCGFRPGWLAVLGWFQLAGFFWLAVLVAGTLGAFHTAQWIPYRWNVELYVLYGLLLGCAALVRRSLRRASYKGVYGIAKEKLAGFCRRTAVALARQAQSAEREAL